MVTLIRPRNEAEFVYELKSWYLKSNPGRSYFQMTGGTSGLPDFLFGLIKPDGTKLQFHGEAKYVDKAPNTLKGVLGLMRDIQVQVCLKMAAAGFNVYLIICVGGKESLWYLFDQKFSYDALHGKIPKHQALYLRHVGFRDNRGRWLLGEPNSPTK